MPSVRLGFDQAIDESIYEALAKPDFSSSITGINALTEPGHSFPSFPQDAVCVHF